MHWHESAMDLHVFPIPIPPSASLPIPSLWVFPVPQPWALVSCIQSGLVVCFSLDSILVSILFSQNIPPLPHFLKEKHWGAERTTKCLLNEGVKKPCPWGRHRGAPTVWGVRGRVCAPWRSDASWIQVFSSGVFQKKWRWLRKGQWQWKEMEK